MKTTNDFKQIVLNQTPLIDVRAPIEYTKGAFLNAVNLPIMNNEERRLVGITYKGAGSAEATKLGHQLVSGPVREERIQAWIDFIKQYPNGLIYCFRGGSRSQISQQWIKEALGEDIIRLEGGYKAFRNYLMKQMTRENQTSTPILLSGFTGSGKTILLNKLENKIDLEGIANHRGSSFGHQISPQPSQIDFENNLAYALIKHNHLGYDDLILEDEGANVGRRFIPDELADYFKSGSLVLLDVPFDERVQLTFTEYVEQAISNANQVYHEAGLFYWKEAILESLKRIYRRLGDQRYQEILADFNSAYQHQLTTGSLAKHKNWIASLLKHYYDPMYDYQIKKRGNKVLFRGNTDEVFAYLKSMNRRGNNN